MKQPYSFKTWHALISMLFVLLCCLPETVAAQVSFSDDFNYPSGGVLGDALIAFDLNSMWPDHPEEVKIKLNWKSFSGKKSMEFPLKMHSDKSFIYTGDIAKSHFVD